MAIDFNKFGKSPSATTTSMAPVGTYAPTATPAQPVGFDTPVSEPVKSGVDFGKFGKSGSGLVAKRKEPKENPLAAMAKGIFGAPATMVARPFQLAAEAILPGDNTAAIDKFSKEKLGGIVAPIPQDYGDVKKDVGRGIQTVALGTGAPIAGGAAFGLGASLEQGNDLLSIQTAFNTALGGAGGKVLEVIGKPLFNTAGKAVGVVTPQILKDVAAKGAGAIQKFMQENKLLGGAFAPASEKIATGLQAVDDKIVGGIRGATSKVGTTLKEQYPQANLTKHYEDVNRKDFLRPTTINESKYAPATKVYNEAKRHGINLEDVGDQRGVVLSELAENGSYNSLDKADDMLQETYKGGDELIRPAMRLASGETRRVPISEIRERMLSEVDNIKPTKEDAEGQEWMREQIERRYADNSPAARKYKYGYDLENLYDSRIVAQKHGGYKPQGNHLESRPSELARMEGQVFNKILDDTVPADFAVAEFRREQEKSFRLIEYLKALHGKKAPAGMTKKALRLFGRLAGATAGAKMGGYSGLVLGAQGGDFLLKSIIELPNPLKLKLLNARTRELPAIYKEIEDYIARKTAEQGSRLALPAAGQSSFKPENPRLFTTPGGKSTPVMQEALDIAAVESGAAKQPTTDTHLFNRRVQENLERSEPYIAPDKLPVIKAGKKPRKSLNQLYKDLPIIDVDTPLPTLKKKTLSSNFIPESPKQASVDPLISEARGKTLEEFVGSKPSLFHTTSKESAQAIEGGGFKAQVGDRSASAVVKGKGVFLYEDISPTKEFGKNFVRAGKEPVVVEARVSGKIFNSTDEYASINALANDTKLINKLKSEGYVGIRGEEMGTPVTFIFDETALKTKSQLNDIWKKANGKK